MERELKVKPVREMAAAWTGLAIGAARLVLTDGRTAGEWAATQRTPNVAVFDRFDPSSLSDAKVARPLAYAVAEAADQDWLSQAPAWLSTLGFVPVRLSDAPGLVVARTLAMLINEAADAVLQGVCSVEGADDAMKLGVNYPRGPFEWLANWSADQVAAVLDAMDAHYRGERYRVSPWLQRRVSRTHLDVSRDLQ